jgi:hypothetical protein
MTLWRDRAYRGLNLIEGDRSDEGEHTWRILNHVLDEQNRDDYVSRDFFNVQQTAGGLPPSFRVDQFVAAISGHVRNELEGGGFEQASDDDFRRACSTFDDNIRRHIRFLNGVVHQIAPGEVHVALWEHILRSRNDDRSIYACYRDYLVDA